MLEIKDLSFRYSSRGPAVLDDIDLDLPDGQIGIVLGKNGSGKTTLFKNILGICSPDAGSIRFDGEDLLKKDEKYMRDVRGKRIFVTLRPVFV